MEKQLFKKVGGWALAAVLASTALAAVAQEKVIKIGVMSPVSGPGSYFGVMGHKGFDLAVEQLNKTGVNGYKFQLGYEDSQCAPLPASNAVKRSLETFKPDVVIGEECSDASLAIAPILEAAKVPMINAGSSATKLTESGYKYVFRIFPNTDQQALSLANNLSKHIPGKNAVMLYEKTNAGIDLSNAFEKAYVAAGGKIVGRIDFGRDVNDFTSIATRVAALGQVDVLPTFALEGQTVKLAQALAQAGVVKGGGGKAIQAGTIWLPWGFEQKAGKASVGYIRIVQFDPNEQRPMVQDFVKAFKAKYGADQVPTHINAHAYDTVMVVADAVKKGAKDAQSMRDQLAKIKGLQVTTGIIAIDAKGQTTDPSVIHYVETTPELGWKTLNWQ
jgi:branched-chain amino acid transport system substrate-binding protein